MKLTCFASGFIIACPISSCLKINIISVNSYALIHTLGKILIRFLQLETRPTWVCHNKWSKDQLILLWHICNICMSYHWNCPHITYHNCKQMIMKSLFGLHSWSTCTPLSQAKPISSCQIPLFLHEEFQAQISFICPKKVLYPIDGFPMD